MSLRADVREANEILDVIRSRGWTRFPLRDLHQRLKSRNCFKRVSALERGLNLLVKESFLTREAREEGHVGRPSVLFDVHPSVHSEAFEGVSGGLR
jgi:hypothetical protein